MNSDQVNQVTVVSSSRMTSEDIGVCGFELSLKPAMSPCKHGGTYGCSSSSLPDCSDSHVPYSTSNSSFDQSFVTPQMNRVRSRRSALTDGKITRLDYEQQTTSTNTNMEYYFSVMCLSPSKPSMSLPGTPNSMKEHDRTCDLTQEQITHDIHNTSINTPHRARQHGSNYHQNNTSIKKTNSNPIFFLNDPIITTNSMGDHDPIETRYITPHRTSKVTSKMAITPGDSTKNKHYKLKLSFPTSASPAAVAPPPPPQQQQLVPKKRSLLSPGIVPVGFVGSPLRLLRQNADGKRLARRHAMLMHSFKPITNTDTMMISNTSNTNPIFYTNENKEFIHANTNHIVARQPLQPIHMNILSDTSACTILKKPYKIEPITNPLVQLTPPLVTQQAKIGWRQTQLHTTAAFTPMNQDTACNHQQLDQNLTPLIKPKQ